MIAKIKFAKLVASVSSLSKDSLDQAFRALSAFLHEAGAEPESFVLIGGSALLALGLVTRVTRDADILARVDAGLGLVDPRPLSQSLQMAALRVARELDLDDGWLNTGPADQVVAGLPVGFCDRLSAMQYGTHLKVYLPDRFDLIHLKLFAAVDDGGVGRHVKDLAAMSPSDGELSEAVNWVLSQDSGEVFPALVRQAMKEMGYDRIVGRL